MNLKKNDKVIILAGKDKGKTGEIREVIPSTRAARLEQARGGPWGYPRSAGGPEHRAAPG